MARLDETRVLPAAVDLSGPGPEQFLTTAVSRLRAGVGTPITPSYARGDATTAPGGGSGPSALAAEWASSDGTLVSLVLTVATRELRFAVDTEPNLRDLFEAGGRPRPAPWWIRSLFIVGIPAAGVVVGFLAESVLWGIVAAIGALIGVGQIGSARTEAERAARNRTFDEVAWRRRPDTALAAAAASPEPIQ